MVKLRVRSRTKSCPRSTDFELLISYKLGRRLILKIEQKFPKRSVQLSFEVKGWDFALLYHPYFFEHFPRFFRNIFVQLVLIFLGAKLILLGLTRLDHIVPLLVLEWCYYFQNPKILSRFLITPRKCNIKHYGLFYKTFHKFS